MDLSCAWRIVRECPLTSLLHLPLGLQLGKDGCLPTAAVAGVWRPGVPVPDSLGGWGAR